MDRLGRRSRALVIALAAAAALLLAGCDPIDGSGGSVGSGPSPGVAGSGGGRESDCGSANGRTGSQLPTENADFVQLENPCLPLADIAGAVLDVVPASDPEERAIDKKAFRATLRTLTDKVVKADGLATCAYRTDRLAVGIYRQSGHAWSVGVAAVIRGDIDAVADVTICAILDQIGLAPPTQGVTPGPHWDPCIDASRPTRSGEVYTVIIAGTSDDMCGFLREAL